MISQRLLGALYGLKPDIAPCPKSAKTAFLQIAALCEAYHTDLSGHCAPALHLHVACASLRLRHLEDEPGRSEAIRRLVELGLKVKTPK